MNINILIGLGRGAGLRGARGTEKWNGVGTGQDRNGEREWGREWEQDSLEPVSRVSSTAAMVPQMEKSVRLEVMDPSEEPTRLLSDGECCLLPSSGIL